jgi:hypothetical protein
MILDTLTEEQFRKDKVAVKELADFLDTETGRKFAAAMRGGDPMNLLASPENRMARNVRDLAIAEAANPHNLLGVCKGYRLGCTLVDALATPLNAAERHHAVGTHAQRVATTLNMGPSEAPPAAEVPAAPAPKAPKKRR